MNRLLRQILWLAIACTVAACSMKDPARAPDAQGSADSGITSDAGAGADAIAAVCSPACDGDNVCVAGSCEPAFDRDWQITILYGSAPDDVVYDPEDGSPPDLYAYPFLTSVGVVGITATVPDSYAATWNTPMVAHLTGVEHLTLWLVDEDQLDDDDPIVTCYSGGPLTAEQLRAGMFACKWPEGSIAARFDPVVSP